MEELVRYLRALVYLQAQAAATANPSGRIEVLLARAGLGHKEIAEIVGKSPAAVSKAISRAKLQGKEATNEQLVEL